MNPQVRGGAGRSADELPNALARVSRAADWGFAMASILKREGPRGSAYAVRYRDPTGRTCTKTFRRRKDADRFAATVEADMLRGGWIDPAAAKTTFGTYADQWIDTRPGLRVRTVELYRSLLNRHLLPAFGEMELGKITPAVVRSSYVDLERAEVGASTRSKSYRLLRAILNTAVEDDLIVKNPATIKGAGVERSPERPVATAEQVWALADNIEPRFRAMVLTAAFCGLRWGELVGLARRHVDLLHGTITVERAAVQRGTGRVELGPPKTAAARRTIAVPSVLVPELEHHLAHFAGEPGPDGIVFCGERGAMLTRSNWLRYWREARDAAGVPDGFRFHDLRHTSNTMAAATGASTKELMARMGHASPAAALRYQHATADRDRQVAEALGDALTQTSV
jgi:integrase